MEKWVVIVDDDLVNLKRTGRILSESGIHATAVKSGQALFKVIRSGTPDLILLDVMMPDMDGSEDIEPAYLRMGAVGLLRKPYSADALLGKVQEYLGKNWTPEPPKVERRKREPDLETISTSLETQDLTKSRAWMGSGILNNPYRYLIRYMERYHGMAFQVLFSLEPVQEEVSPEERYRLMEVFRQCIQHTLRSSDMMFEVGDSQLFLFLPEAHDYNIERIIGRLLERWQGTSDSSKATITYKAREMRPDSRKNWGDQDVFDVVVDDDPVNLKMAAAALDSNDFRVTGLLSGDALLQYMDNHDPDLILLDVLMPGMDGFETMDRLRELWKERNEVPVIFLTADDNRDIEMQGLRLGATDFIRKPFLPEVLMLRIRHVIELDRLQLNLAREVDRVTKENASLSIRIVQSLAQAIDAKDPYTNGHSGRVAEYAGKIAARCRYSYQRQNEIYLAGLVHDVGKIGVPDHIINKPGRLTPEEFEIIKTHPVTGEKILLSIRERPELAIGARWHHERYDGTGYPDGLAGNSIPETARIIAVADAYDAMTSRRSYRDILPREKVRSELENGKGTQFDPVFADIMLSIMDGE